MLNSFSLLFYPQPLDWAAAPASSFASILQWSNDLLRQAPQLLQMIEDDQIKAGLNKKTIRIRDRQARHQQQPFLPGTEEVGALSVREMNPLLDGRPRMDSQTCFLFLVIRGYLGGIKSHRAKEFITESRSLYLYLAKRGIKMPSLSTINENLNVLTQETRDAILNAQLQWIKGLGLDDFEYITIDSTVTEANSCWPTDSKLIWMLVKRLCRGIQRMEEFKIPNLAEEQMPALLDDLRQLDFEISCAGGKKNAEEIRMAKYNELIDLAEVASQVFAHVLRLLNERVGQNEYLPSKREKLNKRLGSLQRDLDLLDHLISISIRRVLEKEKVPTQDKVPSITDSDASYISKGQRDAILGYRPQVSRTKNGFVVAMVLPQGNAADTDQLSEICEATFKRTGVIPATVSLDDGYSSQHNWNWLKNEKGVQVPSFSGSKGKRIIPKEAWESEAFREARRMRSSVESVIFQLKRLVNFDKVVRRGIRQVREELSEKILAFNFYRLHFLTE